MSDKRWPQDHSRQDIGFWLFVIAIYGSFTLFFVFVIVMMAVTE